MDIVFFIKQIDNSSRGEILLYLSLSYPLSLILLKQVLYPVYTGSQNPMSSAWLQSLRKYPWHKFHHPEGQCKPQVGMECDSELYKAEG